LQRKRAWKEDLCTMTTITVSNEYGYRPPIS
jgi:hypothetical protein